MPQETYLGCSTTLSIYTDVDGTWATASAGTPLEGVHDEIFDMTPPPIDFGQIDVSNMSQAPGDYKLYIAEGFTDYGIYEFQCDLDPNIDPGQTLTDEHYWFEITFNVEQDTVAENVSWHFRGTLIEITHSTPFDDRASSTYRIRLASPITVVNA